MTRKKDVRIGAPLYGIKPLSSDRIYQEYICQRSDGKLTLTTKNKANTFDSGFQSLTELLDFHHIERKSMTKINVGY